MIVSIHSTLFTFENYTWIESILPLFYSQRHIWLIENEYEIFQSTWFLENTAKKQQMIREDIEKAIVHYESERAYYLSIPLYKINEVNKSQAQTILNAPLYIVVEGPSDRSFLEMLIDKFIRIKGDINAKKIKYAIDNHWAIIPSGGGSTWINELNNLYSKYQHYRLFFFSDSDRLYSNHESDKKKTVEKECNKKNISHHILHKREIENYLPLKALRKFAEDLGKEAIYQEFINLTDEERDFYDLENGFKAGGNRSFLSIQQAKGLFNLREAQINRLEIGFGNKSKIMNYFFQKDDSGNDLVTAYDLIEHCKHHPVLAHQNPKGEMIDILSKIAKAL